MNLKTIVDQVAETYHAFHEKENELQKMLAEKDVMTSDGKIYRADYIQVRNAGNGRVFISVFGTYVNGNGQLSKKQMQYVGLLENLSLI